MAEAQKTDTKPDAKGAKVTVKVDKRKTVYYDGEIYPAGAEFECSQDDAKLLMKHGFLEDPDAPEPALPQGARVGLVSSERA